MKLTKVEIPEGSSATREIIRGTLRKVQELVVAGYQQDPADASSTTWIKMVPLKVVPPATEPGDCGRHFDDSKERP